VQEAHRALITSRALPAIVLLRRALVEPSSLAERTSFRCTSTATATAMKG